MGFGCGDWWVPADRCAHVLAREVVDRMLPGFEQQAGAQRVRNGLAVGNDSNVLRARLECDMMISAWAGHRPVLLPGTHQLSTGAVASVSAASAVSLVARASPAEGHNTRISTGSEEATYWALPVCTGLSKTSRAVVLISS